MYKHLLNENNSNLLKKLINPDMCKLDADTVLKKCVIEPIESLLNTLFNFNYFFVIIDGLDDHFDSSNELSMFLIKHISLFPKWFKFLITTRDESLFTEKLKTSFHVINLDTPVTRISSSCVDSTNG